MAKLIKKKISTEQEKNIRRFQRNCRVYRGDTNGLQFIVIIFTESGIHDKIPCFKIPKEGNVEDGWYDSVMEHTIKDRLVNMEDVPYDLVKFIAKELNYGK